MNRPKTWSRRDVLANTGLLSTALAAPTVASCGADDDEQSSNVSAEVEVPNDLINEAQGADAAKLSVLSNQQYFEEANDAIDEALQAFAQQTDTNITNAGINADEGNFVAKQDAAVKAGNVQDLAFIPAQRFIAQLHELDAIVDVSDVVEELVGEYGDTSGVAANFLQIDGQWWGIPFYTIGSGWFLREDWLEEAGISVSDIQTYEDARDAALEITDPDQNRFGWGSTINRSGDANGLIEGVINAYGGAINDNNGEQVIFNSPETMEAVEFLADIYTNPKYQDMLPPGIMSWTDTGNNEAWLAGVIGMANNQFSLYAESKRTDNPVYEATAPVSGFTGPATDRVIAMPDLAAFVIFKGAQNPELAKVVAKFLVAGDALLGLAQDSEGLVFPVYDDVWEQDSYYLEGDPIFSTLYDMVTQDFPIETTTGMEYPQAPSPGRDAVLQAYIMTDMMGQIVQDNEDVESAVETAHNRMVQTFDQLGITQ